MRKAIFIVMGAILAVGIAFAQTDPWWHPLNPQGASAGVSYGTQLPTLVNTGLQPTDGLLAVQITTGAVPTLNMYTQSTATWFTFGMLPAAGLTDDTVPVWDTATNSFIDSGIVDDGVTINITAGTDVVIPTGQLETGDGTAAAPAQTFLADDDSGKYRIGANNIGMSIGGALVMDWEDTNAAGAGADLVTVSSITGVMDGTDVFRGIFVDLTSAAHTGGANSNTLVAIDIDGIAANANTREAGVRIGAGFDNEIDFLGTTPTIRILNNTSLAIADAAAVNRVQFMYGTGGGAEFGLYRGTTLAVVGAAQTVDPTGNVTNIGAGAGASVLVITPPPANFLTQRLTLLCNDANVTLTDTDEAGAEGTINLVGAATDFTCSTDDSITLVYNTDPVGGNDRWIEVSRSVN